MSGPSDDGHEWKVVRRRSRRDPPPTGGPAGSAGGSRETTTRASVVHRGAFASLSTLDERDAIGCEDGGTAGGTAGEGGARRERLTASKKRAKKKAVPPPARAGGPAGRRDGGGDAAVAQTQPSHKTMPRGVNADVAARDGVSVQRPTMCAAEGDGRDGRRERASGATGGDGGGLVGVLRAVFAALLAVVFHALTLGLTRGRERRGGRGGGSERRRASPSVSTPSTDDASSPLRPSAAAATTSETETTASSPQNRSRRSKPHGTTSTAGASAPAVAATSNHRSPTSAAAPAVGQERAVPVEPVGEPAAVPLEASPAKDQDEPRGGGSTPPPCPPPSLYERLASDGTNGKALGAWAGKDGKVDAVLSRPPLVRRAVVPAGDGDGHSELVSAVDVAGDGATVVTGGWDGTVRRWLVSDDGTLRGGGALQGHTDRVEFVSSNASSVSSGGDGSLGHPTLALSGGRDCTLHLWDLSVASGAAAKRSRVYTYDSLSAGCVDWSDGTGAAGWAGTATAAVGTRGGVVALWDVATGAKRCALRGHEGEVTALTTCLAPGATRGTGGGGVLFVSGGADGTARVWDPRQARAVAVRRGHQRRVYSLAAGPEGVVYAGDYSDAVKVHDIAASGVEPPGPLPNLPVGDGAPGPIAGLQFRPNVLTPRGGEGNERTDTKGDVAGLLFSTAAWFAPEDADDDDAEPRGCVQVRAVDASGAGVSSDGGGYLFTLPAEGGLLSCLAVSADGESVVGGSVEGTVNAWKAAGGRGGGGSLRCENPSWIGEGGAWAAHASVALDLGCEMVADDEEEGEEEDNRTSDD